MSKFSIQKATLKKRKAKIAIAGISGSGKTMTALKTAYQLGSKVVVLDSENGSSEMYANQFNFDVLKIENYSIQNYIDALNYVRTLDYDVVIVDSLSHAWVGSGGALDMVNMASKKYKGNSYVAWADVTPHQNRLVATILTYPKHLIGTFRMKMSYVMIENSKGKSAPQKVGMGIVQRDNFEYEFDLIAEMDIEHNLFVTKTRIDALDGYVSNKPGNEFGEKIYQYLNNGDEIKEDDASGWYPDKKEFFQSASDTFTASIPEIAEVLKSNGYTNGYNHRIASDMWKVLEAEYNIPVATGVEQELVKNVFDPMLDTGN